LKSLSPEITRESELSLTTLKTLIQWGENSHPIRWKLSFVIHTTLVKTPTYSSGKRHPKEWEISPTTDNFYLPQWDSHPRIWTFTHHILL